MISRKSHQECTSWRDEAQMARTLVCSSHELPCGFRLRKVILPNISIISAKIATPVKSENKEPATGVKENEGSYHQEEENAEPDVL